MTAAVNLVSGCASSLWTQPLWIHIWETVSENPNWKIARLKPGTCPPKNGRKTISLKWVKKTSYSLFCHLAPTSFPQIYLLVHSQLSQCVSHRPFPILSDTVLCPLLDSEADSRGGAAGRGPGQADHWGRPATSRGRPRGTVEWNSSSVFSLCVKIVTFMLEKKGTSGFSRFCTGTTRCDCQPESDPAEDQIKAAAYFLLCESSSMNKKVKRK